MPSTATQSVTAGIEVITSQEGMLRVLVESKKNGTIVGINSQALGAGTYLTTVTEIVITDYESMVMIKPYDVTGYVFRKNSLKLSDIRSIIPFNMLFPSPSF